MSNRIFCYTDISTLPACEYYEEIKDLPQIVVSSDLRKGINWSGNLFSLKVIDFRQLLDLISPDWTTDITKFQESVVLSEFIRNEIQNCKKEKNKQWLIGCRRNLNSLLSAIILLEEACVLPEELTDLDKNMKLFVDAWKYLIERENSIPTFRKEMKQLESKQFVEVLMNQLFQAGDKKSIVIHGFYYFTPIQRRVFDALEQQGYSLIYLIPYDYQYSFVNEIWEKTYDKKKGYPEKKEWILSEHIKEEMVGEIFEGRNPVISTKPHILEYGSIIEFVNAIKKAKEEGYSVYAANYNQANTILKDFFPEEYGERKLLSYPIGQFIFTLNKMWDEDDQTIKLDDTSMRQCFSSGWLSCDGVSSKKYMQDLEYILPFFSDCEYVPEWNTRISLLEEIYNNAIEPFSSRVSESSETEERWQKVYNNPFNNFSMFAVEPERLNAVITLITQLIKMAEELFGKSDEVFLPEHIKKLDQLLKQHEKSQELYTEEREIVRELFLKLERGKGEALRCFPSDISNAMTLFLNGSFEDEETRSRGAGMVYPLYQIDAAPIKNNSKVHICLCDVNNMPGSTKDYIWPLTTEVVEKCFERTGNKYINVMMQVMDSAPTCNRYFIYSALKNKDVQLSWVNNMNGKRLSASPYIRLLCSIGDIAVDNDAKDKNLSSSKIAEIEISARRVRKYQIVDKSQHVAKDSMMDYALCPMRYVLGYVLEEYPTYQTTFLHNYAINGLVTAVYYLMKDQGITQGEIEEEVLDLFPNLRNIEKRQIKDYLSIEAAGKNTDLGMTTEYAGVAYTDERLKVKFPYWKVREEAKKMYGELMTPGGRNGINLYEPTDVKSACVFCQHADYCRNAIFALDQEAYYD